MHLTRLKVKVFINLVHGGYYLLTNGVCMQISIYYQLRSLPVCFSARLDFFRFSRSWLHFSSIAVSSTFVCLPLESTLGSLWLAFICKKGQQFMRLYLCLIRVAKYCLALRKILFLYFSTCVVTWQMQYLLLEATKADDLLPFIVGNTNPSILCKSYFRRSVYIKNQDCHVWHKKTTKTLSKREMFGDQTRSNTVL